MTALTENEKRGLLYFAIGVTSEGADQGYRLSLAGNQERQADGSVILKPRENSGYSMGTLQTDLGQHPEVAADLVASYQTWATANHPDWVLTQRQQDQAAADLGRDGHTITAQKGRPMDAAVKAHLDAFMASDGGKSFVHGHDTAQVDRLMDRVVTPVSATRLYQNASEEDQAKLLTMTAKLYNQNESLGRRMVQGIADGKYASVDAVNQAMDHYSDSITEGRDHALQGAAMFQQLRALPSDHPLKASWDNVVSNPLIDPTRLNTDPAHQNLPHEYAVIKDAFIDPAHARPMIEALGEGGSYAKTAGHRGFYAEGHDLVVWDKAGQGHALQNGSWRSVNGSEISTHVNADKTMDVTLRHNGQDERLLHITHPGNARGHTATPNHATRDHVQHAGTLREHDHSPKVGELQAGLAALGYRGANDKPITPDNDFGGNTKAALQAFQRAHGLDDDGIAGAKTLEAMRAAQKSPSLVDPAHPGHGMYEQAMTGVTALDAQHGRASDQQSRNLGGALANAAHAQGLTRIDHVVLSDDGSRAYAIQGDLNSPFKQIAQIDTAQAVKQPMEQSGATWQAQNQGQPQVPAQDQQQQQQPTIGR
ncbi:peptidoglycan-binding domain-containing protein [Luteibacter yeojuensis]|uniref:peptidoglycan-binding domain-containing protein n=1 Tax=Luteibacter yeojuensis TaxID=345309 RepID=UPI0006988306|nr:peptidoglycan-binding domain-containing protein [Luteibacter yeojuensis]